LSEWHSAETVTSPQNAVSGPSGWFGKTSFQIADHPLRIQVATSTHGAATWIVPEWREPQTRIAAVRAEAWRS